ncbi:serine/threonine protein kinase [Cordyceps fumosorosea ARSEF 2679]|uniref:Serine/threonine protein kinase n=1 Tax=Cordyceps fumosorosea (strain ARSEF 2679) TaxID=1081104 RepID=A0A162JV67_CORFA|nr:serine/threonine protein kinase [Cordyceps fumosorosea ARSEF 2679]OAA74202.1 serine/threonine protein kinase [Cordyceps fumosorosea ARSEF 2679]
MAAQPDNDSKSPPVYDPDQAMLQLLQTACPDLSSRPSQASQFSQPSQPVQPSQPSQPSQSPQPLHASPNHAPPNTHTNNTWNHRSPAAFDPPATRDSTQDDFQNNHRRPQREVVPGLPRTQTLKRQISERREHLIPVEMLPEERRALSSELKTPLSLLTSRDAANSFATPSAVDSTYDNISDLAFSQSSSPRLLEELEEDEDEPQDFDDDDEEPRRKAPLCLPAPTLVPGVTLIPGTNLPDTTNMSREEINALIQNELENVWILNLSMHFRDGSGRDKFFLTYRERETVWRRVTISLDYRGAPHDSLEGELGNIKLQRDKNAKIYEALRESLPDIHFYDTTTNLALKTSEDRLHVHVVEDANEKIDYPRVELLKHLNCPMFKEGDLVFDSHMSGFVFKVRVGGEVLVKKEVPGAEVVEEFLYEIHALHSLQDSNHVIGLRGLVTDEDEDIVKALLIDWCPNGNLMDRIYDDCKTTYLGIPWRKRERWARQIIHGVADLHESGFVQGDLTLNNVVLDDDENARIIDVNRRGCPVGWEPPEAKPLLDTNQRLSLYIGVKSDLFQLGMVLWALAMEEDEPEIQGRPLLLGPEVNVPDWYRQITEICLSHDPRSRIMASQLLTMIPDQAFAPAYSRIASRPAIEDRQSPHELPGESASTAAPNSETKSEQLFFPQRGRSPPSPMPSDSSRQQKPRRAANMPVAASYDDMTAKAKRYLEASRNRNSMPTPESENLSHQKQQKQRQEGKHQTLEQHEHRQHYQQRHQQQQQQQKPNQVQPQQYQLQQQQHHDEPETPQPQQQQHNHEPEKPPQPQQQQHYREPEKPQPQQQQHCHEPEKPQTQQQQQQQHHHQHVQPKQPTDDLGDHLPQLPYQKQSEPAPLERQKHQSPQQQSQNRQTQPQPRLEKQYLEQQQPEQQQPEQQQPEQHQLHSHVAHYQKNDHRQSQPGRQQLEQYQAQQQPQDLQHPYHEQYYPYQHQQPPNLAVARSHDTENSFLDDASKASATPPGSFVAMPPPKQDTTRKQLTPPKQPTPPEKPPTYLDVDSGISMWSPSEETVAFSSSTSPPQELVKKINEELFQDLERNGAARSALQAIFGRDDKECGPISHPTTQWHDGSALPHFPKQQPDIAFDVPHSKAELEHTSISQRSMAQTEKDGHQFPPPSNQRVDDVFRPQNTPPAYYTSIPHQFTAEFEERDFAGSNWAMQLDRTSSNPPANAKIETGPTFRQFTTEWADDAVNIPQTIPQRAEQISHLPETITHLGSNVSALRQAASHWGEHTSVNSQITPKRADETTQAEKNLSITSQFMPQHIDETTYIPHTTLQRGDDTSIPSQSTYNSEKEAPFTPQATSQHEKTTPVFLQPAMQLDKGPVIPQMTEQLDDNVSVASCISRTSSPDGDLEGGAQLSRSDTAFSAVETHFRRPEYPTNSKAPLETILDSTPATAFGEHLTHNNPNGTLLGFGHGQGVAGPLHTTDLNPDIHFDSTIWPDATRRFMTGAKS